MFILQKNKILNLQHIILTVPVKNDEMFSTINLSDDPYIEKELLKKLYWTDGFVAELVAMVSEQGFRKNYCSKHIF